jgi:hypothetical protein
VGGRARRREPTSGEPGDFAWRDARLLLQVLDAIPDNPGIRRARQLGRLIAHLCHRGRNITAIVVGTELVRGQDIGP